MRYLVKGDCGIPCDDPSDNDRGKRPRRWRSSVHRAIALLCLILAGFFVLQLFRDAAVTNSVSPAASPEWDNPSSVLSWARSNLNNVGWQIRNEIKGAVPFGNLAVMLKLACCAVAAAAFLRGPNKI